MDNQPTIATAQAALPSITIEWMDPEHSTPTLAVMRRVSITGPERFIKFWLLHLAKTALEEPIVDTPRDSREPHA